MKVKPTAIQYNTCLQFCLLLNTVGGMLEGNNGIYYDFLDRHRITHEQMVRIIQICNPVLYSAKYPYIHIRSAKEAKNEYGEFYLTTTGNNWAKGLPKSDFPAFWEEPKEEKEKPIEKEKIDEELYPEPPKPKNPYALPSIKRQESTWSKREVVNLMTNEAHIVGRMLGTGYNLLEPIHGEWIKNWIANPCDLKVTIHQAHRDAFKTTALRLFIAEMILLEPFTTIVLLRKSEDAVKEVVNGVSKILDTPLFQTFANILYPDIKLKGGFKKTTDTALSVDTNLNTSLSGEFQLRALGLGSPLTGKHAKLIITDDIVTTDDRESEAERKNTIAKYQELMNVLSNNKGFSDTRILNIGTPWHEEDAFKLMERGLKPKDDSYEKIENILEETKDPEKIAKLKEVLRQADMKRGKFVYNCYQTGLMTEEDIEWKRQVLNDDVLFAANYLLSLVSDTEKPFKRINNVGNYSLKFFDDCWEVVAHIDCAYGGDDSTSVSVGGFDWDNFNTVVYGKRYDKIPIDENYLEVADLLWSCNVTKIFLETNADKGLIGDKFRGLGFDVVTYHESMNKHTKIVSTIRPFWREYGNEVLPCVQFVEETDPNYLSQIYDYKKGVRHDDCPDNLACLLIKAKFGELSVRVT